MKAIYHSAWPFHPLDAEKYLALITTLGMLCSCTVILSPMGFMIKILNGAVSSRDAMVMLPMLVMMFIQSALWGCFGFVTLHLSICHINAFGALMAVVYLRILAEATTGADRRHMDMVFYGVLVGVGLFCAALIMYVHDTAVQESVFSYLAIFFNVGLYVAPMGHLFEIFQTRKIDNFPLGLTVCGFTSSLLWAEYSLVINSFPYLIPNIIGVACNCVSMLCYGYLYVSIYRSKDMAHLPLMKNRDFPAYAAATCNSSRILRKCRTSGTEDTDCPPSNEHVSASESRASDDDIEKASRRQSDSISASIA